MDLTKPAPAPAVAPFVRSAYNYDMDPVSRVTALYCLDDSRAQQQFKDECDINTIVRRFGLTGELPENVRMPVEGDFTAVTDYQTALNLIIAADEGFMQLPAEVRAEFNNDPAKLVSFCSDPANLDRARALGIARPAPTPPDPVIVRLSPDSGPPSASPGAPPPPPPPKGGNAQ